MRSRIFSLFSNSGRRKIFPIISAFTLVTGAGITKKIASEFKVPSHQEYNQDIIDSLAGYSLSNPESAKPKENIWKLKAFSQNIDDHPGFRFPNHPTLGWVSHSFPELSFENRFPLIETLYRHQIRHGGVNLFVLQELGDNAQKLLKVFFEEEGFTCLSTKYNLHSGSCHYLIAYRSQDYAVKETRQIYFTKSGLSLANEQRDRMTREQKLDHNFLIEFERSAQVVIFNQLKKQNEEIVVVNTQPGLINEHKLMSMERLCSELEGESRRILALGDFNLFDARVNQNRNQSVYQDQIDVFKKHGFNWSTTHISQFGMKSTFVAHPFDILRFFNKEDWKQFEKLKEQKDYQGLRNLCFNVIERDDICLVFGALDGVFTKNFKQVEGEEEIRISPITLFVDENGVAEITDTLFIEREDFNQKYRAGLFKQSPAPKPQLPSDHLGLKTEISPAPKSGMSS